MRNGIKFRRLKPKLGAGPGKVRRRRKEAVEMGLDPNAWFDNVEVVATRRIGHETVQFVNNIYKYWIAYKLAAGLKAVR